VHFNTLNLPATGEFNCVNGHLEPVSSLKGSFFPFISCSMLKIGNGESLYLIYTLTGYWTGISVESGSPVRSIFVISHSSVLAWFIRQWRRAICADYVKIWRVQQMLRRKERGSKNKRAFPMGIDFMISFPIWVPSDANLWPFIIVHAQRVVGGGSWIPNKDFHAMFGGGKD